jgi:hypothetical protein
LGVLAFVRPMAPELIVLHELGMLPIHRLSIRTACHIGIQHPTLDREAPLSEVLPGMALGDRCSLDCQLCETGLKCDKHRSMVTDDRLGRPHRAMAWRKTCTSWAKFCRSKHPAPTMARLSPSKKSTL